MGDRAPVHITIGGALPREHLEAFAAHADNYDLRTEWDGEPFDPAVLPEDEPLECRFRGKPPPNSEIMSPPVPRNSRPRIPK